MQHVTGRRRSGWCKRHLLLYRVCKVVVTNAFHSRLNLNLNPLLASLIVAKVSSKFKGESQVKCKHFAKPCSKCNFQHLAIAQHRLAIAQNLIPLCNAHLLSPLTGSSSSLSSREGRGAVGGASFSTTSRKRSSSSFASYCVSSNE